MHARVRRAGALREVRRSARARARKPAERRQRRRRRRACAARQRRRRGAPGGCAPQPGVRLQPHPVALHGDGRATRCTAGVRRAQSARECTKVPAPASNRPPRWPCSKQDARRGMEQKEGRQRATRLRPRKRCGRQLPGSNGRAEKRRARLPARPWRRGEKRVWVKARSCAAPRAPPAGGAGRGVAPPASSGATQPRSRQRPRRYAKCTLRDCATQKCPPGAARRGRAGKYFRARDGQHALARALACRCYIETKGSQTPPLRRAELENLQPRECGIFFFFPKVRLGVGRSASGLPLPIGAAAEGAWVLVHSDDAIGSH